MGDGDSEQPHSRHPTRRLALLVLALVSFYLLGPSLLAVYGSIDTVVHLNPGWLAAIVACEALSFASVWELLVVVLRTKHRFAVATSQLASNAASLVTPGGAATGAALQYRMLQRAGIESATVGSSLAAASLLTTGAIAATPVLALPAVLGGAPVSDELRNAVWLGLVVFLLLVGAGVALLTTTRPIAAGARLVERLRRRARPEGDQDLATRVLAERDHIRSALGRHKGRAILAAAGKVGFDYLALLAALAAVGSRPSPSLTIVAFAAAEVFGMIPVTPGGLGFVEVGLTGALTLAGVPAEQALVATGAYRLAAFWLPIPVGLGAWLAFRRWSGTEPAVRAG